MRILAQIGFVVGALLIASGAAQRQAALPAETPEQAEAYPVGPCSDTWEWVNPLTTTNDLHGVSFESSRGYLVVGDLGTVLTSRNGRDWRLRDAGVDADLIDLACQATRCFAVARLAPSRERFLIESIDGTTWKEHTAAKTWGTPRSVATDGHVWVLATSGGILRSSDGESWERPVGSPQIDHHVICSNGEFLALDQDGSSPIISRSPRVLRSSDGAAWMHYPLPINAWDAVMGAATNGDVVVVVGDYGAYTTRDGQTWSNFRPAPSSCFLKHVVWTGTEFVAEGEGGCGFADWRGVLASPDGYRWSGRGASPMAGSGELIWTGAGLFAVGMQGEMYASADGAEWEARSQGSHEAVQDVIWDGRQFVGVGRGGVIRSVDGRLWGTPSAQSLNAICVAGSQLVAVGDHGVVLTSTDGRQWQHQESGSPARLLSVAWNGNEIVAGGYREGSSSGLGPEVVVSTDGRTWERVSLPDDAPLIQRIAWTGTEFLAVGYPWLLRSSDGRRWSTVQLGPKGPGPLFMYWTGVATDGTMVAVVGEWRQGHGAIGYLARKTPQGEWEVQELAELPRPDNIYWMGDYFLAVGARGVIPTVGSVMTSRDGAAWTSRLKGFDGSVYAFATDGKISIAVGSAGAILRNDCWASVPVHRRLARSK